VYNIVYPQSGENIGIDYAYLQRYSGCTGDKNQGSVIRVETLTKCAQQQRFLSFFLIAANQEKLFRFQ
jgi:hypothetical protein